MTDNRQRTVGIIGAGLIGSSWAMMFSCAGFQVLVYEEDAKAKESLFDRIRDKASLGLTHQLLTVQGERKSLDEPGEQNLQPSFDVSLQTCLQRITVIDSLDSLVERCFYIQESVPEILSLKQQLFQKLDSIILNREKEDKNYPRDENDIISIIGSSSSALSISSILSASEPVSRSLSLSSLIVHPVNPPDIIPLVELIPSPKTLPSVVQKAHQLLTLANKTPILVKKEVDGFVVNRLQYALLSEAYRLVQDGVASAQDVDAAIADGLGMRWAFMGPFKTIHLNAPLGVTDYCQRYGSTVQRIAQSQDNSISWQQPVIDSIHQEMDKEISLEKRQEAYKWRDEKLLQIAQVKQAQAKPSSS